MPILTLNEWDNSKTLSPYKTGALQQVLGPASMLGQAFIQKNQDNLYRQAAAKMLGVDPGTIPPGSVNADTFGKILQTQADPAKKMQAEYMGLTNQVLRKQLGLDTPQPETPETLVPAIGSTEVPGEKTMATVAGTPSPFVISRMGKNGVTMVNPNAPQSGNVTPQKDITDSVKGMFEGLVPPEKLASFRDVTRVNAEITRQSRESGMNYPELQLEWDATKKFVQNMQSNQQIRLQQSIEFGLQAVNDLKKLSQDYVRGPFPALNKAQLALAMNGAFGATPEERADNAKKATVFNQQLTDLVADLGTIYLGGNSPTDHGLQLAEKNLNSNWTVDQLNAAIDNVDKLLKFRKNAIMTAAPTFQGKQGTSYYPRPNYSAQPAQAQPGQPQFEYGQLYQDAQGNVARYVNGQWEEE